MKLTLPQSQNSPAIFSKFVRDDFVARYVTIELTLPKIESAFRRVGEFASGMSMPETAINKHGELLTRKHEIWLTEYAAVSSPARDTMLSEHRNQPQLSVSISAPADAGHDFRAFHFCEYIGHI